MHGTEGIVSIEILERSAPIRIMASWRSPMRSGAAIAWISDGYPKLSRCAARVACVAAPMSDRLPPASSGHPAYAAAT